MSDVYGAAPPPPDGMRAWNWSATDPQTKKEVTFYTEPTKKTPPELLEHFKQQYRNLDFSNFKIEEAPFGPSKILKPIPRKYFQAGILDAVYSEIRVKREATDKPQVIVPPSLSGGRNLLAK